MKRKPHSFDHSLAVRMEEWAREQGQGEAGAKPRPLHLDLEKICTWLRSKPMWGYARKQEVALRASVKRAIEQFEARLAPASDGRTDGKRARHDDGEEVNDVVDGVDGDAGGDMAEDLSSSDEEMPAGVRLMETPTHNLLNAGLAARYRGQAAAGAAAASVGDIFTAANGSKVPAVPEEVPTGAEPSAPDGGGATQASLAPARERKPAAGGGATQRRRAKRAPSTSLVNYSDLGGMEGVLQDIRELVEYPLTHPEIYVHLGVEPPRGILLHGPPGCGKTLLANAIAGELGVTFLKISAPEIVSGMSGESEAKLRELFADAKAAAPCLVFIDEIDAIAPKRESAQREMERRIVAQLLTCMDELSLQHVVAGARGDADPKDADGHATTAQIAPVLVIAATNRPDALDPALRRAGRFDREIAVRTPDAAARARILRVLCRHMRISDELAFETIGEACAGFVGADLAALAKEAAVIAVNRIFTHLLAKDTPDAPSDGAATGGPGAAAGGPTDVVLSAELRVRMLASTRLAALPRPLPAAQLAHLSISENDFWAGLGNVQPSARREGFSTVPNVTWADVGALNELRAELTACLLEPLRHPKRFANLGLSTSAGVLLYGPPGCGKTLLAKAVANESGACFISVKGPELLSKFVGESERAVRQLFMRAAASPPCIVFFDELDALCPNRGAAGESSGGSSERVVNQLLTEMDGLDSRQQLSVIAATNRPDMIDPAMLRPGRLDKCLYVPLPPASARADILRTACRKLTLADDVQLDALGVHRRCDGYSGADLAALVKEAAIEALGECADDDERPIVALRHFERALSKVAPSVSKRDEQRYLALRNRMHTSRVRAPEPDSLEGVPPGPADGAAA